MKSITITNQDTGDSYTFQRNRVDGSLIGALEGFEYPDVMEAIEDVPNAGGAYYITSKFGRRRIGMTFVITCDRLEERIALGAALRQTGTMKLIEFTTLDDIELEFEAEVVKLVNPYTKLEKPILIELIAADYRFYSQELHEFTTSQTVILGGLDIPADIPFDIGSTTEASPNSADNLGNDVADPVFRIDGPGTGFTVGNQTSDEEFYIDYALIAGQYIEIDVKNRTIKLNGITNIYSSFSGDFWSLQPGENVIRFLVDSGLTVDTLLTITYRDAYNGV